MPKTHQEVIADQEARMRALHTENESIQAQADADGRDLTDAELETLAGNSKTFELAQSEIDRRLGLIKQAETLAAPQPLAHSPSQTRAQADAARAPAFSGARQVEGPKSSWGWRSFAEFFRGVVASGRGQGQDARFQAAASTYGAEGTSADGGYAVPPDFRETILKKVTAYETSILPRTDQYVTSSNTLTLVQDNVAPWTASGIQTEWLGEGSAAAQRKPVVAQFTVSVNRLASLVPLTDELLEDAPAVNAWVPGKIGDSIAATLNAAILAGSGSSQPTGIIGSSGAVNVTAVSGQGAGTVTWTNLVTMYSRIYPGLLPGAEWLVHPTVLPQLLNLSAGSANIPVWLPPSPNDVYSAGKGAPAGTLLGRPVYLSEFCNAVGTSGDVILWNPKTYITATKASGMRSDVSMHFFFDQFMQAIRVGFRVGGKSAWAGTVAAKNGGGTYGNVITLNSTRT